MRKESFLIYKQTRTTLGASFEANNFLIEKRNTEQIRPPLVLNPLVRKIGILERKLSGFDELIRHVQYDNPVSVSQTVQFNYIRHKKFHCEMQDSHTVFVRHNQGEFQRHNSRPPCQFYTSLGCDQLNSHSRELYRFIFQRGRQELDLKQQRRIFSSYKGRQLLLLLLPKICCNRLFCQLLIY